MTVALPLYEEQVLVVRAYRGPRTDPPYDTDDGTSGLALAAWPGARPRPAPLRLVPDPDLEEEPWASAQRTPRDELEAPLPRATVLARAFLEALAGDRPVGQLARWTSPEVFDELAPLVASSTPRPWAATVRRVLVAEPAPGVAEVTAIVERGPRASAMAFRMEGVDGRWLVTALQM